MKNKLITILVLASLILPSISQALIFIPTANITIVVNTQGEDSAFTFNLSDGEQFNLQTENLTTSYSTSIVAFGNQYVLSQENIQGLKIGSINCVSDNQSDIISYTADGVIFSPISQENIICTFNNVKGKTPILIVPGLMGTEMKKGNELLWADVIRMVNPFNTDSFMDPLQFNSNVKPVDTSITLDQVITSKPLFDYSEGLISTFVSQGYAENENLFTFPYDWRYGASGKNADGKTNSDLLGEKIQNILAQTGSDKVDVVAHSQGGLVVKKYVVDHSSDHHIGKAVFVGVPNTGSLKAIKVLLQGDNFGVLGLSESEMKKISVNLPTAYDLLPTQQYYDAKGSFVKVIDYGLVINPFDTTEKDLTYNQFGDFLTLDHNFNSQALTNAENLHTQAFDEFDMRTVGIDLYAIDGCKTGTLDKIVERRSQSLLGAPLIDYQNVSFSIGDGTVPFSSSTNLPIDQSHKFYMISANHGKMLSDDGSRQEIVNLLAGTNLSVSDKIITQDVSKCKLNGKDIEVHSPVDIFVTDQDGHKLGLATDGSIINEIPNAAFELFGEHKFLYLPTDEGQIYTINMKGTGTGTYTIDSKNIVDSEVTGGQVFSNLPVTTALTGSVNLQGDQTTLTVKETPQSTEKTILPLSTVDAVASQDVLPPISTATLTGTAGQAGFYRSNVNIVLGAIDDVSGVLNISYKIDSGAYQKVSTASTNFNIGTEGAHTVSFFATDKAGNNEQEQTLKFTIDKISPEAVIEFDPSIKDLKFSGQEVGVTITDQDDTVTLADQAGNITEIKLKDKDRKKAMSAEIKSLKYNGVAADITKNIMQYKWKLDKNKNITELSQHVKSRKDYNVNADFDGKNTVFKGKDGNGKIKKSVSGLKTIKISTDKGDFNWSY